MLLSVLKNVLLQERNKMQRERDEFQGKRTGTASSDERERERSDTKSA